MVGDECGGETDEKVGLGFCRGRLTVRGAKNLFVFVLQYSRSLVAETVCNCAPLLLGATACLGTSERLVRSQGLNKLKQRIFFLRTGVHANLYEVPTHSRPKYNSGTYFKSSCCPLA